MKSLVCLLMGVTPLALYGNSTGPPIMRTGAQVDGGQTCAVCHTSFAPANSDPRGKVTILADPYTPGVKQTIKVRVEHPEAMRWGFQLTARLASVETKQAGTFDPRDIYRVRCAPNGAGGPCNGALEFISHNRLAPAGDSTFLGTPGGYTHEVSWIPPAADVGNIVFYAAGNAANGNGNNQGDRIYTTSLRIGVACAITGRPAISANGVVNAGSFRPGMSVNSMISIFGTGLAAPGTIRAAGAADFDGGNFPKQLACVSVQVAGRDAPVTFVSANQINAQAPTVVLSAPVNVEVIFNKGQPGEVRTALSGVQMQNASPAFFTFNGRSIAALHTNFDIVGDPAVIRADRPVRPAKPGDVVSLFGTGFGLTDPVFQTGEIAFGLPRLQAPVSVTIGSLTLRDQDVMYAGLSPGSITGLYQLNVRIPDSAADGDIPVVVRVGGLQTQDGATIAIKR